MSLNTVHRCVIHTERKNQMRSAPETDIFRDFLRSLVENNWLIAIEKTRAASMDTTGVSVSQQLVPGILKTLGYSRKNESYFKHGRLARKSQRQHSWKAAIRRKHRNVGLFFSRWHLLRMKRPERILVIAETEHVICTSELEENKDIIIDSSYSGFTRRRQSRSWSRLTRQHPLA